MSISSVCADVLLPLAVEGVYTYALPSPLRAQAAVGVQVLVPLGKAKIYTGIILRLHSNPPAGYALKEILQIVDPTPLVTPLQLDLWQWMSDYYMATLGELYKAAVPAAFRLDSDTFLYVAVDSSAPLASLSSLEQTLHDKVLQNGGMALSQLLKQVRERGAMAAIQRLHARGVLLFDERVPLSRSDAGERVYTLTPAYKSFDLEAFESDPQWQWRRAPKQLAALVAFFACRSDLGMAYGGAVPRAMLLKQHGIPAGHLDSLVRKGILEEQHVVPHYHSQEEPITTLKPLSPEQERAYQQLLSPPAGTMVSLLHGVTGSGKTEIYTHLIAQALLAGRQTLYLVPEIALTTQLVDRMRGAFGHRVGVYHSRVAEGERLRLYRSLLHDGVGVSGQRVEVVLAARSGIFLPLRRLGLVIVDEEHESSFKQESPSPRYSGRDAAIKLASLCGARVVLGSATPSIESYFNALAQRYQLVRLDSRFGVAQLPTFRLVDMARARRKRRIKGHFTFELLEAVARTVASGGQVILFQNRRGYAPTLSCADCGWISMCNGCDVSLTYHMHHGHQQCHYCGAVVRVPKCCPVCRSEQLSYGGLGTQRVVEELGQHLPQLRVARLDLDTTRAKLAYQRIFDDFSARRYDVLVGTQMVTKGLDFHGVRLVGVMDADALLGVQDFRAMERAFQLMAQVGGRAGRGDGPGEVIVQTRNVGRPIFRWILQHDYSAFYAETIAERKAVGYPPYWRLISVMGSHPQHAVAQLAMDRVAGALRPLPSIRLLGPQAPLIARVARMHRVQLYIKVPRGQDHRMVRRALREALRTIRSEKPLASVRFSIDIDPV